MNIRDWFKSTRPTVIARKYRAADDTIRVQLRLKGNGSQVVEGMFNMAASGDVTGERADRLIKALRHGKLEVRDET